jgi:hypothetical protein
MKLIILNGADERIWAVRNGVPIHFELLVNR